MQISRIDRPALCRMYWAVGFDTSAQFKRSWFARPQACIYRPHNCIVSYASCCAVALDEARPEEKSRTEDFAKLIKEYSLG